MTAVAYLLQPGSGFVFQALITDFLTLIVLGYISITTVYPFIKKISETTKMAKDVGGPKPHWFWGDAVKYGYHNEGLDNSVKRCEEFPAMSTFYLGRFPTFCAYHPDVNKTAFTRTASKAWEYKHLFSMVLHQGLITSEGSLWKRHRRLLTTIFHFDILREHCKVFNSNFEILSKAFDEIANTGKAKNVSTPIFLLAYTNMMESIMSQSTADKNGNTKDFLPTLSTINHLLVARLENPLYWLDAIYKRTKTGKRLLKATETMYTESNRIIKERKAVLESITNDGSDGGTNVITDQDGKSFTFKKRKGKIMDFLDILIQTKDEDGVGLSDDEIADEVVTFFLAGWETAATAISWTSYLLATHQEIQDKCRTELSTVLGDKKEIEMSDLNKLPYLNQCVKESMRLYPPVHAVARCLERDTVFSHQFDGGKKIALKKGTNVIVNIYVTHRNPSIWENPEVFDPERFNDENITKIPPYAYIPFAAGSRNCIGQHLGLAEVKVTIAQLIRRYQIQWDSNLPHPTKKVGATVEPDGGISLIVKRI